jgi:hypothetical protein
MFSLAKEASSLQACFAQSAHRLPMEGSPRWFPADDFAVMIWPTASAPC